jgi:hypothetical protein
VEQLEPSWAARGNEEQCSYCGGQFGCSSTDKTHNYHIGHNSTPRYIFKRTENGCPNKDLHVHNGPAHKNQTQKFDWEQLKSPLTDESKRHIVCTYDDVLLSQKRLKYWHMLQHGCALDTVC